MGVPMNESTSLADGLNHRCVFSTLCEGDYDRGVGAMINSLYRIGYRGKVVVGYRGRSPRLPGACGVDSHGANPSIEIEKVPVEWSGHLCNYKPRLMHKLLQRSDEAWDGVFYADPDIVFRAPWTFFARWITHGVALCSNRIYNHMSASDPKRCEWRSIAEDLGYDFRMTTGYANSGFLGVDRRYHGLLDTWVNLEEKLSERGIYSLTSLSNPMIAFPFDWSDQDLLNMALGVADIPIAMAGPEGMGFDNFPVYYMSHAISQPKPWRWHMLRDALRHGTRPSRAARDFWRHARNPIRVLPMWRVAAAKAEMKVAVAVARLLG